MRLEQELMRPRKAAQQLCCPVQGIGERQKQPALLRDSLRHPQQGEKAVNLGVRRGFLATLLKRHRKEQRLETGAMWHCWDCQASVIRSFFLRISFWEQWRHRERRSRKQKDAQWDSQDAQEEGSGDVNGNNPIYTPLVLSAERECREIIHTELGWSTHNPGSSFGVKKELQYLELQNFFC